MRKDKKTKKRRKLIDKVVITSARKLDSSEVEGIMNKFGKDEIYEFKVDKSLIGGIRINNHNYLLDNSIQGKLEDLRQKLYSSVL